MTDTTSKTEQKPHLFKPGNRANPKGRPQGSRNKATLLLDSIADGAAEAVLGKVLDAARDGDLKAAEIILARIWPHRKSRTVRFDMPGLGCAADLPVALGALAEAVGAGDLTPDEGQAVAAILEAQRKAIETAELESRISKLEAEARS